MPTLILQPNAANGIDNVVRNDAGDYPKFNYGIATALTTRKIDGNTQRNVLVKFPITNLSFPAGYIVVEATIYIYNATQVAYNGVHYWSRILAANAGWVEGSKNGVQALAGESCWNARAANGAGGITTKWAGDAAGDGGTDAGCSQSGIDFSSTAMGSFTYLANDVVETEYAAILNLTEFNTMLSANNGLILWTSTEKSFSWHSSDYSVTDITKCPKLVVNYTLGGGIINPVFYGPFGGPFG
jgi:hypothetical protein